MKSRVFALINRVVFGICGAVFLLTGCKLGQTSALKDEAAPVSAVTQPLAPVPDSVGGNHPPICVAWPPFASDAERYPAACSVGSGGNQEVIKVHCHAHIGREVFPQANGGPELHCIEDQPSVLTPPRVFGAPFSWAELCPDKAASGSTDSASPQSQAGSPQQQLKQQQQSDPSLGDMPPGDDGFNLSGGSASVAGQFSLAAESAHCCSGPLTGKSDPERYNCAADGTNCVTFMLSGTASPLAAISANPSDPLRAALCAKYVEEGGARGPEVETSATHRGMLYEEKGRCLNSATGKLAADPVDHGSCLTSAKPN